MSRVLTSPNPKHPHSRLLHFKQQLKENYRKLPTAQLDVLVNAEFMKMSEEEKKDLTHPNFRHEKMEFLLNVGIKEFKSQWKKHYGWDFEDSYNPGRLHGHMARIKVEQQEKEFVETHLYIESQIKELGANELTPEKDAQIKEYRLALLASPYERKGDELVRKAEPVAALSQSEVEEVAPQPLDTSIIRDESGWVYSKEEFMKLDEISQTKIKAFLFRKQNEIVAYGFGGVSSGGLIVDRRLVPDALPIPKNGKMGVPAPRELPVEDISNQPDAHGGGVLDPKPSPCEYCGSTVEGVCGWPNASAPCLEKAANEKPAPR